MKCNINTEISFEQYAAWATSRYPGYHVEAPLSPTEEVVYASAETVAPDSSDACPVTVRSNRDCYIVTPSPQRSR